MFMQPDISRQIMQPNLSYVLIDRSSLTPDCLSSTLGDHTQCVYNSNVFYKYLERIYHELSTLHRAGAQCPATFDHLSVMLKSDTPGCANVVYNQWQLNLDTSGLSSNFDVDYTWRIKAPDHISFLADKIATLYKDVSSVSTKQTTKQTTKQSTPQTTKKLNVHTVSSKVHRVQPKPSAMLNRHREIDNNRSIPLLSDSESESDSENDNNNDNNNADQIFDVPDNVSITSEDLDNMTVADLESCMADLKKVKKEEKVRLTEAQKTHEADTANLSRFSSKMSYQKRVNEREQREIDEVAMRFEADRNAYYMIKQDLEDKKISEVPKLIAHRYPIFEFMDEKDLLNQDDSAELFQEFYDDVYKEEEDLAKEQEQSSYVPHNIEFLSEEEQAKYNQTKDAARDKFGYIKPKIASLADIMAGLSTDSDDDFEEGEEEPYIVTENTTEDATEDATNDATEDVTNEVTNYTTENATEDTPEDITEDTTNDTTEDATEDVTNDTTEDATNIATADNTTNDTLIKSASWDDRSTWNDDNNGKVAD